MPLALFIDLVLRVSLFKALRNGAMRPDRLRFIMQIVGLTGTLHLRVPVFLLAFTIALVYAPMHPLIAPIAALFFAVNYVGLKYMMIFVQHEGYQSGGELWPLMSSRLVFAVLLAQVWRDTGVGRWLTL